MRIVLASPLYPPEIAEPAPYVKELAKRLSKLHSVTVVTYATVPEEVEGVQIIATSKYAPLVVRLVRYFIALIRTIKRADILYAENGASVELPVYIASLFFHIPIVMHLGDKAAHSYAQKNGLYRLIERLANSSAKDTINDMPLPRPEIMPFEDMPAEAITAYEHSWDEHVGKLNALFSSYANR